MDNIKHSMNQIEEYMKDISEGEFKGNKQLQDAVIRRLEVMGKVSKNVPSSIKEKNKQVPWLLLSKFGDFTTYYYNVKPNMIWKVYKEDLPKIKKTMLYSSFGCKQIF